MSTDYLEVVDLSKRFDGVKALSNFSCHLQKSEILGLIGPNGAGKSTLFNLITGFITPDSGKAKFEGADLIGLPPHKITQIGIARTFQELRLIQHLSVLDNALLAFSDQPGERLLSIFFRPKLCTKREVKNGEIATSLLEKVALAGKLHEPAKDLSYGQQKLLSIVCCLATEPSLLLLDEPVAGIAPEMTKTILSIISDLPKQGRSVILIEHNIDAVMQVCDRVIFMDAGTEVAEGTPEEVRNDPKVIEAYLD